MCGAIDGFVVGLVLRFVVCFFFVCFFFFQAEDGIRDYKVTGVQTCALPICPAFYITDVFNQVSLYGTPITSVPFSVLLHRGKEIGRASCRERV